VKTCCRRPGECPKLPAYLNEDLALVPELALRKPIGTYFFTERIMAYTIATINHVNQQKEDGFLHALIAQRDDLRGLPFLLGKDCRTEAKQARVFAEVVDLIRKSDVGSVEDSWKEFGRSWEDEQCKWVSAPAGAADRARVAASCKCSWRNRLFSASVTVWRSIWGPSSTRMRRGPRQARVVRAGRRSAYRGPP